jgi:hypothetical protein
MHTIKDTSRDKPSHRQKWSRPNLFVEVAVTGCHGWNPRFEGASTIVTIGHSTARKLGLLGRKKQGRALPLLLREGNERARRYN